MNIHVDGQSAETHGQLDQFNPVFSPGSSSMASPGSPNSENSGGGKMARKKSTASSTSTDEDDISNIPSLQTRIQIISQRVNNNSLFTNLTKITNFHKNTRPKIGFTSLHSLHSLFTTRGIGGRQRRVKEAGALSG